MGAWGIKALESDEGLDVLNILENEYVPEHPAMDFDEIIQLMKEQTMLGEEPSQIDFLFDLRTGGGGPGYGHFTTVPEVA